MYLKNFQKVPCPFQSQQDDSIQWIARAHEKHGGDVLKYLKKFSKYIEKRGSFVEDFSHESWENMKIHFPPRIWKDRMDYYEEQVLKYGKDLQFQNDFLVHVSCTGYMSPSPFQRLAPPDTEVIHAYHMGCYASIPALRIAKGFEGSGTIVHTELCTLHFNPASHSLENLVIETLFADGFIAYDAISQKPKGKSLKVNKILWRVIPDTVEAMSWYGTGYHMAMTLSSKIPEYIQNFIEDFLKHFDIKKEECHFAVHPGGLKIIDTVHKTLALTDDQVQESWGILKEHGNMSSATLPYIWSSILENPRYPYVLSLAFGPGLTIAGCLFEVCDT